MLCFASKVNEIQVFLLLFTILGIDLKKNYKTSLNVFLCFFTNCPRIVLDPFSLWSFCFFFVLFLLHLIFVLLQMRKQEKKHFFRIEAKKMSLPFRVISLWSENDGSFSLPFRFISLRSENDGSFLLPSRFISLQSENDGSFSLLFCLVFAPFHFRFASDIYVSHRCETSEKSTFFASKWQKFRFRFASFHFEAKMTAHPRWDRGTLLLERLSWTLLKEWRHLHFVLIGPICLVVSFGFCVKSHCKLMEINYF